MTLYKYKLLTARGLRSQQARGPKLFLVAVLTTLFAFTVPAHALGATVSQSRAAKARSTASPTMRTLAATGCGETLLAGSAWLDGQGVDVKSNGSYEGSGTSCGGESYVNGVPAGSEWQCVELVDRLYLTRGWISKNWYGNGGGPQALYYYAPSNLSKEPQGQITHLAPGDVLSLNNGTNAGHTEVANTVTTTSGGGYSARTVSQNYGPIYDAVTLANGTATMASGMSVIGVVHAPTPLHASVVLIPNDGASGYRLDGYGGLHPFGNAPPVTSTSAYWPGWDIARGIAIFPRSTWAAVQGYVLDGYGGIHPFAAGSASPPPTPALSAYWQCWDIARGIVLRGNTGSGYVLDGYGGVHPFGGAPAVSTSAYWQGWDIARAIAMATSTSGYVLDGYGGIHPFGGAPRVSTSAYWQGWDIARAIAMATSTSGYVLDGYGGIHPFGGAPGVPSPGYAPSNDIFRGIAFDPSTNVGADVTETIPGQVYQW